MEAKETHKRYTIEFKLAVVDWVKHHGSSYRAASKQFGVDRKMVRQWINSQSDFKEAILKHGPRRCRIQGGRPPLSEELDKKVLQYLVEERLKGSSVSDKELQDKAVEISESLCIENFKGTTQWLRRWKKRQNVAFKDGTNDHFPSSTLSAEVTPSSSEPCRMKGDAILSHIEPKEQVKLEKKRRKVSEKQVDLIVDNTVLSDNPEESASPSLSHRHSNCNRRDFPPPAEKSVVFDFSAPEHSYCQLDCFIEEEMCELSVLEDQVIFSKTIAQDGTVEAVGRRDAFCPLLQGKTHGYQSSNEYCCYTEGHEELDLGQEITICSNSDYSDLSVVNSVAIERARHTTHDHRYSMLSSPARPSFKEQPFSLPMSSYYLSGDHSYSLSGHPFSIYEVPFLNCDFPSRPQDSAFHAGLAAEHDPDFTLIGGISPQLHPPSPTLSFLHQFPSHPPLLSDIIPDLICSGSPCGGEGGSSGGVYASHNGTAPIVYVDRPTSPPCAITTHQ